MTASSTPLTVFLDADTVKPDELDLRVLERNTGGLRLHGLTTPEQLLARTEGAQCVITNKVRLERRFFEQRPEVRLVCVIATGTNNVDLDAARDHGVAVANCRGYSTESVAQHTLMLMLMLLRSIPAYEERVRGGGWSRSPQFCLVDEPIVEAAQRTLGIVGYGDIGKRVHQLATAFGIDVLVSERPGQTPRSGRTAFDEVVKRADILSLHCPLTEQTRGLVDAALLAELPPGAFLINTARGELVDEPALADALRAGDLAGAALDVLSAEPPPPDHPLVAEALPNLILTPHNAWASRTARQTAVNQTADNILAWTRDEPLRRVV